MKPRRTTIKATDAAATLAEVRRSLEERATLYAELTSDRRADLKAQEEAAKQPGPGAIKAVYLSGYNQGLIDAQEQAAQDTEELLTAITPATERAALDERNAHRRELEAGEEGAATHD